VRKLICQNCGQEFTPKQGSDSKNLCPKCFIQKLNHVAANNSGNDPAANKTIMDQPIDQPDPTVPGAPVEPPITPPASPPTGEEPTPPEPVVPTPGVSTPAPEEEEEPAGEGGETPMGGEIPPVPPVV